GSRRHAAQGPGDCSLLYLTQRSDQCPGGTTTAETGNRPGASAAIRISGLEGFGLSAGAAKRSRLAPSLGVDGLNDRPTWTKHRSYRSRNGQTTQLSNLLSGLTCFPSQLKIK